MVVISDFLGMSAVDNVKRSLAAARDNETFNSLISLSEERALERAERVDAGEITGRLAGVPFIAKDNFLTFGADTTAASDALRSFKAPLQATAIERLEAEGAICIGKANLDSFAHGGSTENSAFGVTKNAHDDARVAGGSSGGSAVVVALGIVPFALGTDTGGSIRQPASFNGVVGVKPTYGAVSRFGVISMASSTDTVGVLSASADDAALIMDIMSGRDTRDMTTLADFFQPTTASNVKRVAIIKEFMTEGVDPEVKQVIEAYAEKLKSQGVTVEEVSLPTLKYALPTYYIVMPAEVSSNLARYDGIRYANRANDAKSLDDVYGLSREQGFTKENKRRIIIGSYVLSSGYFDAYYMKAQKARTRIINEFEGAFEAYDALIGPVAPDPAFKIGENAKDPIKMYMADIMTVPASLAGLPALSIPAGTTAAGLPVGVQIIGPRKSDANLLAFAKEVA